MGLMTIAAMLPSEWDKKLVDVNVTELRDEDIVWSDFVFVSAMIIQSESGQQIIDRCRSLGRTVVVGGPAASSRPETFSGVDHYVLNEAEITLPYFLADLEKGEIKPMYQSTEKPDITKTPAPLWSLVNLKDYAIMPVQYSRGCPFNCEFCDIIVMYGRKPRTKTPEQLISELQSLYDAGWRGNLFIVDDNFIGNKSNVKKMLPQLIKWQKDHKYPFTITTETSTNLADDEELLRMMSAANFHKVFVGIETPNVDSLVECGKAQNVSCDLEESVKIIQRHGMQVMGGFIVGFDSDTESVFDAQIKFIQKVGIVTAMVGLLNALPQTRLWHRLKAEGRLIKETSGENTDASINFIPNMGHESLLVGYQKILSTIYSPREYYARINTFMRNYKPRVKDRVSFQDLRAAIRSMWRVGVLSRSRLLYWKLLTRTSLLKIKALPLAVEFAIYGLHFEKITERISVVSSELLLAARTDSPVRAVLADSPRGTVSPDRLAAGARR